MDFWHFLRVFWSWFCVRSENDKLSKFLWNFSGINQTSKWFIFFRTYKSTFDNSYIQNSSHKNKAQINVVLWFEATLNLMTDWQLAVMDWACLCRIRPELVGNFQRLKLCHWFRTKKTKTSDQKCRCADYWLNCCRFLKHSPHSSHDARSNIKKNVIPICVIKFLFFRYEASAKSIKASPTAQYSLVDAGLKTCSTATWFKCQAWAY